MFCHRTNERVESGTFPVDSVPFSRLIAAIFATVIDRKKSHFAYHPDLYACEHMLNRSGVAPQQVLGIIFLYIYSRRKGGADCMENLRRLLVTVIGMKNNCILYIRPDFSRKSSPILQLYPAYQAVVFPFSYPIR